MVIEAVFNRAHIGFSSQTRRQSLTRFWWSRVLHSTQVTPSIHQGIARAAAAGGGQRAAGDWRIERERERELRHAMGDIRWAAGWGAGGMARRRSLKGS